MMLLDGSTIADFVVSRKLYVVSKHFIANLG